MQDDIMPRYAELVYNGFWFSPERLALQVGAFVFFHGQLPCPELHVSMSASRCRWERTAALT